MSPLEPARNLSPPLRLAWSWARGYGVQPLLAGGMALVHSRAGAVEALDERTGRVAWSFRPAGRGGSAAPALVVNNSLLATLGPKERYGLLNLQSGRLIKEVGWAHQGRLKLYGGLIFCDGTSDLCARRPWDAKALWRIDLGQDPSQWTVGEFDVADGRLVYGVREGPVCCIDVKTGQEVWRTSIADLTSGGVNELERPGEVHGRITIHEDVVVVECRPQHVVGISLRDGERRWTHVGFPMAGLYAGRYYVSAGWLDPRTGRLTRRRALRWPPHVDKGTWGGFLISETHVFVASLLGDIVAWDRATGKHAWHTKVPEANGQIPSASLVSANGRLYYVDQNQRLYCYEAAKQNHPESNVQSVAPKRSPRSDVTGSLRARSSPGPDRTKGGASPKDKEIESRPRKARRQPERRKA
jgi:outer membrane protein assembly factor BamB